MEARDSYMVLHDHGRSACCAFEACPYGIASCSRQTCSALMFSQHPSLLRMAVESDGCRAAPAELDTASDGVSGRGAAPPQSLAGVSGRMADDLVFDFDGGEAAPQTPRLAGVVPQARRAHLYNDRPACSAGIRP